MDESVERAGVDVDDDRRGNDTENAAPRGGGEPSTPA
jgi:hypothetical protein